MALLHYTPTCTQCSHPLVFPPFTFRVKTLQLQTAKAWSCCVVWKKPPPPSKMTLISSCSYQHMHNLLFFCCTLAWRRFTCDLSPDPPHATSCLLLCLWQFVNMSLSMFHLFTFSWTGLDFRKEMDPGSSFSAHVEARLFEIRPVPLRQWVRMVLIESSRISQ